LCHARHEIVGYARPTEGKGANAVVALPRLFFAFLVDRSHSTGDMISAGSGGLYNITYAIYSVYFVAEPMRLFVLQQ
jgi:hypothetical protein